MSELFYYQEKFGKTQVRCLRFAFQITGAKAIAALPPGGPILTTFDAISSQAVIDAFLNTSSEFPVTAFDAVSMGANTFGGIVDMKLQAAYVSHLEADLYTGAGGSTRTSRGVVEGPLSGATVETAVSIGASGNIAFKVDFGGVLDAATAGLLVVRIYFIAK